MELSKFEEPLAKTGPRLLSARKNIATTRSRKNLQGLYEAVPEGAVLVKTTDATLTLKMPGQKDMVLHKSDVAKFGTPEQRNIPLINFAARKTVRNQHKKLEELMRSHGKAQMNKIMGIRTIRKRDTQPREPHARSNLEKVSRTKVPPKRRYIQSPKKGKPSKDRSRESSQSSHEEPAHNNYQKDDSASDPSEEFEVDTSNLPSRRSQRVRTRTTPYGTDPNDNEDSLSENEYNPPTKKFSGISNYQTPQAKQAQATTSTTQVEFPSPYAEEMQGNTNVILTTADPLEREVTTRAGDEERELNPEEL